MGLDADHGLDDDHGLNSAEVQAAETKAGLIAGNPKLKELFLTVAEILFEKEEEEAAE